MNPVLTVQEAAQVLKVQPLFVYQLCETGKLRHSRLGKGKRARIRIQESDLAAYLEENAQGPSVSDLRSGPVPKISLGDRTKRSAKPRPAAEPDYSGFSWFQKKQPNAGR